MTAPRRRLRRARAKLRLDLGSETKTELMTLAKRIEAEHKAATTSFNSGFKHAINAGNLLIEAKAKLKHGGWLAWLKDHCHVGERMAQIYMRLAREAPNLDPRKAKHVSDLSMRAAMRAVSSTAAISNKLSPADAEKDNELIVAADQPTGWMESSAYLRGISDVAADIVSDLKFRTIVRQLHDRGSRFLCEFLAHIAAERSLHTYIEQTADRFLKLDVAVLEILGAALTPTPPRSLVIDNEIEGGEIADDDNADRRVLDSSGSAA
jgi:hypothetical protein